MKITILTEADLRSCVFMDEVSLAEVTDGFSKLAEGKVTLPPILRVEVPENHGEVDVKTAYIHGLDSFAIKIASGFFDNRLLDLPTGSGIMILVSAQTGRPIAVLLDYGYLTDLRTGIAGAIAARHLAREKIENVGVIGSGMQARYQVRGLQLVRDFKRLFVYGVESDGVDNYVSEMMTELGIEVIKANTPEVVVREGEVVITTTPSHEPYLESAWLHPGLHITAMGSDAEYKQELFSDVFNHVDLVVCDRKNQAFRLGELHHAREASSLPPEAEIVELGELTSGMKSGRTSDDQITVCDLTGVGVQDTQIARFAYERAIENSLGLTIDVSAAS
ncbi:MAG: cyclodeaminase [Anaerolineales bacterium]|nr:cyclodeaminase [Anaerolineales bacterium]